ncbi:MAG TPA: hypothetical protein VGK67_36315 [Myxococcales bacterium]
MKEEAPRGGAMQTVKRFLVLLFIVALAGAALVLFSALHSKTWAVEQHENELWIVKGRQLPAGFEPYRPGDKVLAAAYSPIALMGDSPGELVIAPYDDRDALDQALFRTFKSWIEARLDAEDPERLTQAFKLLKRLELLTGVAAEQREQLKDLQAKVAYVEGRARLDDAELALREAVAKLKLASETRNRYAKEAAILFEQASPVSEQLSKAVRQAKASAPEPKRDPATTTPPLPAEKLPIGLRPADSAGGSGDGGAPRADDAASAAAPVPEPGGAPDASAAP